MTIDPTPLFWRLARLREYLGPAGLTGLTLLAVATIYAVAVSHPRLVQIQRMRSEIARTEIAQRHQPAATGSALSYPQEAPSRWLTRLHAIAESHALDLAQGRYQILPEAEGTLLRYQIVLPLRGRYPELRTFIGSVLAELPIAGLENVEFKREEVVSPELTATVTFVLFLQASP